MESGWFVVMGAAIGIVPGIVIAWMNNKTERKKQLRQLAMEMALAEYKFHANIALNGGPDGVSPPMTYLGVSYASVLRFMEKGVNTDNVDEAYEELAELVEQNAHYAKKHLD